MTDLSLRDCVILVVEDEYLLAREVCAELAKKQAVVLGPAATIEQGFALVRQAEPLNGAILDINLRGESVFLLADELAARDVPFVFTTGYDGGAIPPRFAHVVRCEKPIRMAQVVTALGRVASE